MSDIVVEQKHRDAAMSIFCNYKRQSYVSKLVEEIAEIIARTEAEATAKLIATALELAATELDEYYSCGHIARLRASTSSGALDRAIAEARQSELERCVGILEFHGHHGMANALKETLP